MSLLRSRLPRAAQAACLLLAFIVAGLAAAPAHAQFNGPASAAGAELNRPTVLTTSPELLYPPAEESVLRPGDQLQIRIYGEPDYTPTVRVELHGDVDLPLIGKIHLGGLSVADAEMALQSRFESAGMFRDPQVTIVTTEGPDHNITVIGETHGVVPAIGNRHLLEVLAATGGLPPTASHVISINRPGLAQPIVVDLGNDPLHSEASNIPVFAGDTIVVSRIGVVYVLGAFKTTGIVPLNSYGPLTLTELTSLSGGVAFTGKFDDLRIVRTVGNQRTVSTVDIKKVLDGKAPDPILQPNDIVYLPPSALKTFFSSGTLGTILGVTSLAVTVAAVH
jgi:polysaccharide export outer membrane protein